jgi:hypothetical protein
LFDAQDAGEPIRLPAPRREHSGSLGEATVSTIGRADCGKETIDGCGDYTLVNDELWASAGMPGRRRRLFVPGRP